MSANVDEDIIDPFCRADQPKSIPFEDVKAAAEAITSGVMHTPCIRSHLSSLTGVEVYLKSEFLQHTGSFKERGARYALLMLPEEQKKKGVIAASAGNHAQAISYHGKILGIKVTVVMPLIAPIMKIQKCKKYLANVIVQGKDMGEAKRIAMKIGQEQGLAYINGYDHPHIIAGQGTAGLEIVEQVPDVDAVVIQTGGGSLMAGNALAIKHYNPNIKVIGVESERCQSFTKAMEAGKPVVVEVGSTLADGLAVPMVGFNSFETAKNLVDKMIIVSEEMIAIAVLRLVELEKFVIEGAGATGLAALISGQLNELKGKKAVFILSGGNVDTTILGRSLERALAADGRLIKLHCVISDRPGGVAELCYHIASVGVSIKHLLNERAWLSSDVFSVDVKVICETRDYDHAVELRDLLLSVYGDKVIFKNFPKSFKAMCKCSNKK